METRVMSIKEPSKVRGNIINCINFSMCPLCYGCRSFNSLDAECIECKNDDAIRGRNYNICKTNLHEAWKINNIINKNKIEFKEEIRFESRGI